MKSINMGWGRKMLIQRQWLRLGREGLSRGITCKVNDPSRMWKPHCTLYPETYGLILVLLLLPLTLDRWLHTTCGLCNVCVCASYKNIYFHHKALFSHTSVGASVWLHTWSCTTHHACNGVNPVACTPIFLLSFFSSSVWTTRW